MKKETKKQKTKPKYILYAYNGKNKEDSCLGFVHVGDLVNYVLVLKKAKPRVKIFTFYYKDVPQLHDSIQCTCLGADYVPEKSTSPKTKKNKRSKSWETKTK